MYDRGKCITNHTFFNLKKAKIKHTLAKQFERCFHTLHFPMNRTTFVACLTRLHFCLNRKYTSAPKSACFASFVLLSKMRMFVSTALLFPTAVRAVDGESPSSFTAPAHFCFGSQFTTTKPKVSHLSMMGFTSSSSIVSTDKKRESPQERPKCPAQCKWCLYEGDEQG